ncbi:hypothetical protein [Nocardia asiatica]|uniref:hypothetical protein n=1 Tax=Nocardia asiatica TaxID=209252 RepID=UPI002453DA8C|nr:hypothetical protein [Nocardia asiatica]
MTRSAPSLSDFEPTRAHWRQLAQSITRRYKGSCWGWRLDLPSGTNLQMRLSDSNVLISPLRLTLYQAGMLPSLDAPMHITGMTCTGRRRGPDFHYCVNPKHVILGAPPFTEQDKADIRAEYRTGTSLQELADRYRRSVTAIRNAVGGEHSRDQRRTHIAQQVAALMYIQGSTLRQISKHLGYSETHIRNLLVKAGEELRPPDETRSDRA